MKKSFRIPIYTYLQSPYTALPAQTISQEKSFSNGSHTVNHSHETFWPVKVPALDERLLFTAAWCGIDVLLVNSNNIAGFWAQFKVCKYMLHSSSLYVGASFLMLFDYTAQSSGTLWLSLSCARWSLGSFTTGTKVEILPHFLLGVLATRLSVMSYDTTATV